MCVYMCGAIPGSALRLFLVLCSGIISGDSRGGIRVMACKARATPAFLSLRSLAAFLFP